MAMSRSASSKMMNGASPPSSRVTRLSVSAEALASALPTAVEPVNDSLRTRSSSSQAWETCGVRERLAGTRFSTPAGRPASSASTARARADRGVSSAGLATTVQPAARAGPNLRAIIATGKFQGVITATTPTGSRRASICRPATGAGITSPVSCLMASANHSM